MAKLRTAVSALGSLKDANRARAEFDSPARKLADEEIFPPSDVRPTATEARTLLLRITDDTPVQDTAHAARTSQGDTFAVIHVPADRGIVAILTFNPSTQIEAGQTFGELVDEAGWPVFTAMAEEFLGVRADHVMELSASALSAVIDELGPLAVYSRSAFSTGQAEFSEGTNKLDGASAAVFVSAAAVDDAGQTRTRNQRALLRALVLALKSGGLVREPARLAAILGYVAQGSQTDSVLTTVALGRLAGDLRQVAQDDVIAVTVPSRSVRAEDGSVTVTFDAEARPALRQALIEENAAEFVRGIASMGY